MGKPAKKGQQHNTNARKRKPKQSENLAGVKSQNELAFHIKTKQSMQRHKKTLDQRQQRKMAWLIIFVLAMMLGGTIYMRYQIYIQELVVTPLDVPKMISHNLSAPTVNPEKFWGTYRSNLYFGLKTRSPTSPVLGLMWLEQATMMPPPIRHWCSQDDRLSRYGWLKHDGVNFGIQNIEEQHFNLTTSFVKQPGGEHGGDWTARISAIPKDTNRPVIVSLMFYIALDGQGSLKPNIARNRMESVNGQSIELGNFKISFPKARNGTGIKYHHLISYSSRLDRLKDLLQNSMRTDSFDKGRTIPYFTLGGRLIPKDSPDPNFMVHQVTAQLPLEMDVVFESESHYDRHSSLQGELYTHKLERFSKSFDDKFTEVFNLEKKGYNVPEIYFAKAALSNMVGSIGYFYGSSVVKSKYNKEPIYYWPAPLYTAVPSRSFFPRGFLWDEGFHNLLISQWDPEISKDIIAHWLDLLNAEGWIPREQILGIEAIARVPEEFVVQRNENANPPTLFLPLQLLIKDMTTSQDLTDKQFLKSIFPRLKKWFSWFNTTQVGNEPLTYYWRGRDDQTKKELNPKTLTSGLDDYPRASHPNTKERHVDLRCWMALASGILSDIAKELGENWKEYEATHIVLSDNGLLDKLHWSPKKQRYSDYGLHSDRVVLVKPKPPQNLQPGQPYDKEKIREVKIEPQMQFVESFGYVSLFPFMLKIVEPSSLKLYKILNDLTNTDLLWTNYGLRSLARNAPQYQKRNTEHDPPYWRGAIWINMNYLTLSALHHYSNIPGPYQQLANGIYKDLRANVVNNLIKEYYRTGYIYEQYDDKTGEGKGCHPFTGWSALVVLIMAEKY